MIISNALVHAISGRCVRLMNASHNESACFEPAKAGANTKGSAGVGVALRAKVARSAARGSSSGTSKISRMNATSQKSFMRLLISARAIIVSNFSATTTARG